MRNLFIFFLGCAGIFLISSCEDTSSSEWPDDLAQLREVQKEKRSELRDLELQIKRIEQKIDSLDTTQVDQLPLVTVDTLIRKDFKQFVEVQGRVTSQENVTAAAEMAGTVTSLRVEEGEVVQRGQLIATIDASTLQSQKQEIQTQLELARDIFERQKRLWEQNIGSEVEFLQAKNRVESLEQSLETFNANLRKTNVYAAKSGVVDEITIKEGMFAAPGTPILTIIDHRQLKVRLEVPESYLGKVRVGDTLTVKFPTIELKQRVKVSRIGNTINQNNRTFFAEAKLQLDENGLIRPNMLAIGMINNYYKENVLQVPIDLVQQEVDGDKYVFVKGLTDGGPVAAKQYVEVGKVAHGKAVIENGLQEGQIILVVGARGLAENERIRIQESQ